jgi:putative two-component system response regulator
MLEAVKEKKKIVIADDDEMCLTTAELFLRDEYEIHKAHSGEEALDYLTAIEFIPDLILLDIIMPGMSGWEVFKRIKETSFLKDIPIIFVTSLDNDETKERARKLGAADYITKPYNMTELLNSIKRVLKKRV